MAIRQIERNEYEEILETPFNQLMLKELLTYQDEITTQLLMTSDLADDGYLKHNCFLKGQLEAIRHALTYMQSYEEYRDLETYYNHGDQTDD